MRKISLKKIVSFGLAVFLLAFLAAVVLGKNQFAQQVNNKLGISQKAEAAPETYQIISAPGEMPDIVQATIDPRDVSVGQVQHLTLIVKDDASVTSVEARIETDKDTVVLPMGFTGQAAASEVLPARYAVGQDSKIFAIADSGKQFAGRTGAAVADAAEAPALKYEVSWTVRDTHNAKYHTIFVLKDSKGRSSSVTLAWSDACSIPLSGSWSLASVGNCTISANDGVEAGTVTIASYTLTIQSNVSFAWNSGYSISLSPSGHIAMAAGTSKLLKTQIWMLDGDSDGYPANTTQYLQASSPGTGYRLRSALSTYTTDCDDTNASYNQLYNYYYDADGDGVAGNTSYALCSDGNDHPPYYRFNYGDCNDSNPYAWQVTYDSSGVCVGNSYTDGNGCKYYTGTCSSYYEFRASGDAGTCPSCLGGTCHC